MNIMFLRNHSHHGRSSFLLATCTFTPLYGRLCNVMGRRGANQTAVIFAGLGTLACGLSPSMNFLIAARFVRTKRPLCSVADIRFQLTGIGGGGVFTTALYVLPSFYSQPALISGFRVVTSDMFPLRVSAPRPLIGMAPNSSPSREGSLKVCQACSRRCVFLFDRRCGLIP